MKKVKILPIVLILVLICSVFGFSGCANSASIKDSVTVNTADISTSPNAISADKMTATLKNFLGVDENNARADRTPFAEGEQKAAAWLVNYLSAWTVKPDSGEGGDVFSDIQNARLSVTTQEVVAQDSQKKEYKSANVIATLKSSAKDAKQVIIGANYDSSYGSPTGSAGKKSEGALENGAGVATVLNLAEYL